MEEPEEARKSNAPNEANPMHTSIILDNNTSGYLRRQGKGVGGVKLHRKRFYHLDGSILTKQATDIAPATWHANILGATVEQTGKNAFIIVLRDPGAAEGESRLVLYAKNEELCKKWVQCLHSAATRTLERHYRIGDVIGEGGFASVRLGQCRKSQKVVAIKTIRKEKEYMTLYGREIAVIKRVDHENIVRTFDLFETDKKIHIVMEYMKGGMLFEAIEDGHQFAEMDVAQLMREILHGVMYLHDNGIVHRDLKPENVLCTDTHPPWHVKLADFGLSKFSTNGANSTDLLMKTMIGTPEFIAPEVAKQQNYTSKVDIWAVGMLMYNVVTGKLPFDDEEVDFVGMLRKGIVLTFPEKQWARYSPEARLFTKALLCPEPEKRLTALGALVHPWLDDEQRFGSSRFSAHGRFSMRPSARGEEEGEVGKLRPRRSVFFGVPTRQKPSWVVAFIAVRAMNRFVSLVRPKENVSLPALKQGQNNTSMMSSMTGLSDSLTDFEAFSEDEGIDASPTSIRFLDEHSPSGSENSEPFKDGPVSTFKLGKLIHSRQQKSTGESEKGKDNIRGGIPPGSGPGFLAGPLRKASGLLSKSPAGPARKGSLRAMFQPKSVSGLSSLPSPLAGGPSISPGSARRCQSKNKDAAAREFDELLGLGDLGLSEIDDGSGKDAMDGPASFLGAKHIQLLNGVGTRLSPKELKLKSNGKEKPSYLSRMQMLNKNANSSFTRTRVKNPEQNSQKDDHRQQ